MSTVTQTIDQRKANLEKANARRLARAALKRELKKNGRNDGKALAADWLRGLDENLRNVEAHEFLTWIPGFGDERAHRVLSNVGVFQTTRPLDALTARQRDAIAEQLAGC